MSAFYRTNNGEIARERERERERERWGERVGEKKKTKMIIITINFF